MGAKEPKRPKSIPETARWDADEKEWIDGPTDAEGKRHGPHRFWTPEGVRLGECTYEHGALDGDNTHYHPDGKVASICAYVKGSPRDWRMWRSEVPTTVGFPGNAGEDVHEARYLCSDGIVNHTLQFFRKDGTECAIDGSDLPPRPANVPPDARWIPDDEEWMAGATSRAKGNAMGPWKYWALDGRLVRTAEFANEPGEDRMLLREEYFANGQMETRERWNAKGKRIERATWFESGKPNVRRTWDDLGRPMTFESWYEDGDVHADERHTWGKTKDELLALTERGPLGRLELEAKREGDAMACVLYEGDGVRAAEGLVREGKLAGKWRLLQPDGSVRREVDLDGCDVEVEIEHDGFPWRLGSAIYAKLGAGGPIAELAGVEAIDWSEVEGCYSEDMESFPDLLRALVSDEPFVRRYALGALSSEIEHQGSTYEATARVVPFYVKLLEHPNADRGALIGELLSVGNAAYPYVGDVQELPADDKARIAIEGTVDALGAAWPVFERMLKTSDAATRRALVGLAKHPRDGSGIAGLAAFAKGDPDREMRACAIDALGDIRSTELAVLGAFLSDSDPLVRAVAATNCALKFGSGCPRPVVAALGETLSGWETLAEPYGALPFTDTHLLAVLALALGSVRSPEARALAPELCRHIDRVDAVSATTYGRGLCALALGNCQRPFAPTFVDVIDTLAKSKKLWVFNANTHEVLRDFGLPTEPGELLSLVAELRAATDPEGVLHGKIHRGGHGHGHDGEDDDEDDDDGDLGSTSGF